MSGIPVSDLIDPTRQGDDLGAANLSPAGAGPNGSFRQLLGRVRQGDPQAIAELVRRYEHVIRRAARFHLTDSALRRTCDSADVCQSVLLSFFLRAAKGQFDLDSPEQLLRLFTTMAHNKALNRARDNRAGCRDNRLVVELADHDLASGESGPDQLAEVKDLVRVVRDLLDHLPPVYRRYRDAPQLRSEGHSWDEIGRRLGCSGGHALRMHEALVRWVRLELGLEDGNA